MLSCPPTQGSGWGPAAMQTSLLSPTWARLHGKSRIHLLPARVHLKHSHRFCLLLPSLRMLSLMEEGSRRVRACVSLSF